MQPKFRIVEIPCFEREAKKAAWEIVDPSRKAYESKGTRQKPVECIPDPCVVRLLDSKTGKAHVAGVFPPCAASKLAEKVEKAEGGVRVKFTNVEVKCLADGGGVFIRSLKKKCDRVTVCKVVRDAG